ncbi:hypothetical protein EVG20_g6235 [Dentipellis fragilis]|uniref:Uncharacterized protein n=1 Tax=Dentipellis fragilis TaxID=205917 RepID=A0A4Y9YMK1_9AGAM|nr:hypothetical protein EVG20_g6235 [Dentipellis fragilis]
MNANPRIYGSTAFMLNLAISAWSGAGMNSPADHVLIRTPDPTFAGRMSPSSSNNTMSLTGGMPTTHQDIAPSVIFIGLYLVTSALCFFRMLTQYRSPTRLLLTYLRLTIFETVRIATFVVRILGAKNYSDTLKGKAQFNETLLIVEQILISIGYIMPASALVKLLGFHGARKEGGDNSGRSLSIIRLLELAITAAIILGIIAGVNANKSLTDSSTAHSVKTERHDDLLHHHYRSACTHRGLLPQPHAAQGHPAAHDALARCHQQSPSHYLPTAPAYMLQIVVPIYRIATTANPPADSNSTGAKVAFYIFQIAVEWLVGASLLAVNAKEWCGIADEAGVYSSYSSEEAHKLAYTSGSY